jgi:hypothetical protein
MNSTIASTTGISTAVAIGIAIASWTAGLLGCCCFLAGIQWATKKQEPERDDSTVYSPEFAPAAAGSVVMDIARPGSDAPFSDYDADDPEALAAAAAIAEAKCDDDDADSAQQAL